LNSFRTSCSAAWFKWFPAAGGHLLSFDLSFDRFWSDPYSAIGKAANATTKCKIILKRSSNQQAISVMATITAVAKATLATTMAVETAVTLANTPSQRAVTTATWNIFFCGESSINHRRQLL